MIKPVRLRPAAKPARPAPNQMSSPLPFGPPGLIPGEDPAAYAELLARVRAAIGPLDVIDEISVGDVVKRTWQIERLHRFETALLAATAHEALADVLSPLREFSVADDLIQRWTKREPAAVEEVNHILAAAGLTMDAVMAKAFAANIAAFETIEHMISLAEARRERSLRDVERRRLGLGRELRGVLSRVDAIEPEHGRGAA